MSRILISFLLLLLLLAGGSLLVWYLAYQADPVLPDASDVSMLATETPIHWQENGVARIEASSRADAAAALGYVHGTQRTWTLALWRQTALGQLGEWFGRGLRPLDEHTRRLDFGDGAESAYAQLPDSTRRLLQAYAAGVNAALDAGAARHHDELVVLNLNPAPWQPWHSLALERLLSWLATTPPADSARASMNTAAQRFFATDDRLRQWLHVHGMERSVAWGVPTPSGPALFQRHVFGTSALPLLHEVLIENTDGRILMEGGSLPGTPFLPAGRSESAVWAVLLQSPLELTFAPVDSTALTTQHSRIRFTDGGEALLTTERLPQALPLGAPDPRPIRPEVLPDTLSPADSAAAIDSIRTQRASVWQLRWPGLGTASDATSWLALTDGAAPSFQLIAGHGLRRTMNSDWQVLGTPPVVERVEDGILVGQTEWAAAQAQTLRAELAADTPWNPAALSARDSSAWAAQGAEHTMPFLALVSPSDTLLREATTYLRNWDYTYTPTSIGASVFEAWLRTHRAATDSLPFLSERPPLTPPADSLEAVQWSDSLRADSLRRGEQLHRTLEQAVDSLATQFGSDLRRWRWERVSTTRYYFPVWSADSLVDRNLQGLPRTRYAPLEQPGRGHPSTLAGGTSLLDASPPPAAAWEGWTTATPDAPFVVRPSQVSIDGFLRRYTAPGDRPPPVRLRGDTTATTTTVLRPAP